MDKFSYLSNADVSAIEDLYQQFLNDPKSVEEGWAKFFEGFEFARANYSDVDQPSSEKKAVFESSVSFDKEFKVLNLISYNRKEWVPPLRINQ